MRVLVIGGSGFVGARILEHTRQYCCVYGTYNNNDRINPTEKPLFRLDVSNRASVVKLALQIKPDIVILICGTRDIAYCNACPELAKRDHHTGTQNVIEACEEVKAKLAYVSTDCVFDGAKKKYDETDDTNPFNVYGMAKQRAEAAIKTSKIKSVIARLSLTYGITDKGQNSNFISELISSLENKMIFRAAENLYNTPIEVDAAACAISTISMGDYSGIFHVAGSERISRFHFAKKAAEILGYHTKYVVPYIDTSGLRPINSCLSNKMTGKITGIDFQNVHQGLEYIKKRLIVQAD